MARNPIREIQVVDEDFASEMEVDTISGSLQSQIDGKDNYQSWSFAVDGVTKDAITSGDILYFIGGDNITITRTADDQITISGTSGGGSQNHDELNNLDYASAGHTGFTSTADLTTTSGSLQTIIDEKIGDVVDDTTPQLGGDLDTNSNSISWNPVPGSDQTANGDIATMQVDANATGFGAALHLDTDGNLEEANANDVVTMPCFVLALETGTGSKEVLLRGFIRDDAWDWAVNGQIYIGATAGTLTQTKPSGSGDQVQTVGIATHADRMFFNPNYAIAEV